MAAAARGEKVVLVRPGNFARKISKVCTLPRAFLTARGGMTSHAAVVARGMGTCCVAGCGELSMNRRARRHASPIGGTVYHARATASPLTAPPAMSTSAKIRHGSKLALRGTSRPLWNGQTKTASCACAPTPIRPKTRSRQLHFGAEGVGLCRTEHMFFDEDRIAAMREMIVSKTVEQRKAALAKLLPMQAAGL